MGSNSVILVATDSCWFGGPLSYIMCKVVGCVEEGGLVSGGVVGVRMGIIMGIPSFCGGRDGLGTIFGGCKYQTGIAKTILGRVSIAAT